MGRRETPRPRGQLLRRVLPLKVGPRERRQVPTSADRRPKTNGPDLHRVLVQRKLERREGLEGRHRGRTLSRSGQGCRGRCQQQEEQEENDS